MKIKVASLKIITEIVENKPYYSVKYKEIGHNGYHVGYSSFDISTVAKYVQDCFEIIPLGKAPREAVKDIRENILPLCAGTAERSLNLAIKALEKQIPVEAETNGCCWFCPECGGDEVVNMEYCPNCGQKLEW